MVTYAPALLLPQTEAAGASSCAASSRMLRPGITAQSSAPSGSSAPQLEPPLEHRHHITHYPQQTGAVGKTSPFLTSSRWGWELPWALSLPCHLPLF